MRFKDKPYIFVLLSVILWASTPAVGKLLLEDINSLQLLLFTSISASISLLGISAYQGKLDKIRSYSLKDFSHFALMGFIGVFLYYTSLFAALMFTTAQKAFILNYTWPIWTAIFGIIILNERISLRKVVGMLLGFLGVYIVATEGAVFNFSFGDIRGVLLALIGAVFYGLFSILGKKYDYERFTSMAAYYGFTFVYTLISVPLITEIPSLSMLQILGVLWLGIFSSGLGFLFWFLALKHGDTAKMSNYIFLTPFVSLIYIFFLVGEKILFSSFIGLVTIVAGILIQHRD